MSANVHELAKQAQQALRTSRKEYWIELANDVHAVRGSDGVQKVLKLVEEYRAHALYKMANGNKDSFEANQASWKAWDLLIQVIEQGPKTAEKLTKGVDHG